MLFELDFRVIDIAERPEVYYQRGQSGRFIGRSGNSWGPGKSKFLSVCHKRQLQVIDDPVHGPELRDETEAKSRVSFFCSKDF